MRNVFALICLIGLASPGFAQEPTVVITQPDESKFPEITVYFEVRNPDGTFLRDATKDRFRVTEEDRDRPIIRFEAPVSTEVRATSVVLVVDRSKSMLDDGKIDALKKAVRKFLEDVPKGSRIAVIAFGSEVDLICPFTEDKDRVRESVDRLRPFGATRYFDGVSQALALLAEESGRRAVLALTDGQDTASETDLDSAISLARRFGLPVHTLGLGTEEELSSDSLKRLAADTRGQSYRAENADDLRKIYEELAERLGASYSLTYLTERAERDGTLRPIKIYFGESKIAAETKVFIRGMVVPYAGWPGLFLVVVVVLLTLSVAPGLARR